MPEEFRLTSPEPLPVSGTKPDWWLASLESATREHRRARAAALRDAHAWRAVEAEWVRHIITEGMRDEWGLYVNPDPMRRLPEGVTDWSPVRHPNGHPSTWLRAILHRWDTEIRQASRGRRRLVRREHERLEYWRDRVIAEVNRRVESRWHQDRARGQEERFERVAKCGEEIRGYLTCTECSDRRDAPLYELCDALLLCPRCRAKRAKRYRAQFVRARAAAVQQVRRKRAGIDAENRAQCRDPITEKFLTLTAPHIPVELGGAERQARIVRDAWRPFMNALRNHWRKRQGFDLTRYVRCLEATEGSELEGHTHIHAWILGPFVRDAVIAVLWGRALLGAGFPPELWPEHAYRDKADLIAYLRERGDKRALSWAKHVLPRRFAYPIVDVQRVTPTRNGRTSSGADLANELIKYLTKDLESDGRGGLKPIHPAVFAAIYRGLDGARMLSAALGFWIVHRVCCTACGCVGTLRPVATPGTDTTSARGPPTLELLP